MLPQRGVSKGLEGLVQVDELMRDPRESVLVVEPTVQRVNLVAEPVEPLENGVELPVVEEVAVGRHTPILAGGYGQLVPPGSTSTGFEHGYSPGVLGLRR